jgi:glucose 1-dehydrogenase
VALVTGAARGIGRAVAVRFAAEGASVWLNDRQADSALDAALAGARAAGPGAHGVVAADVAERAAVDRMVAEVAAAAGRLDILVNNAGIQAPGPSDVLDEATYRRVMAVTLDGAVWAARAALAQFLAQGGGGVILNCSSVHETVPKPGYLSYALAKGAIGNLTRTLALEYADRGIRVNAVAPGATLTDMNAAWAEDPVARRAVEGHIPLGRAATPEEIAGVFAFLASDDAAYITGQTIFACGGVTLHADFQRNWSS